MEHICETIGYFNYNYRNGQLLINEAEYFIKQLNKKIIYEINNGNPVNCDGPYFDYFHNTPSKSLAKDFTSTDQLKIFLSLINFVKEPLRPLIVSRTQPVAAFLMNVIGIPDYDGPKKFSFHTDKSKGLTVYLESEEIPLHIPGFTDDEFVSEHMIKKENVFEKAKYPKLGQECSYHVPIHRFTKRNKGFEMILSKEFDEMDSVEEGPAEIRAVREGSLPNMNKLLLKAAFLGNMDKAVINVMRGKELIKVQKYASLRSMDNLNRIKCFENDAAKFFSWLLEIVLFTEATSGEIRVSEGGIVVYANDHYAVFNKHFPRELNCFQSTMWPWFCHGTAELPSHPVGPRVVTAQCWEDIPYWFFHDPNCFLFASNGPSHPRVMVVSESGFIEFLGLLGKKLPLPANDDKPVLAVAPQTFKYDTDTDFCEYRNKPWALNIKKKNVVVFRGPLIHLDRLLAKLKTNPKTIPEQSLDITVMSFNDPPHKENHIRAIVQSFLGNQNVHILSYSYRWKLNICHLLAGSEEVACKFTKKIQREVHCLYLVGGNFKIKASGTAFDIQLVSDFLANGLDKTLTLPEKIICLGASDDFNSAKEKAQGINTKFGGYKYTYQKQLL